MKRHCRTPALESLECKTLLSSLHPVVGHASPAAHTAKIKLPAFVRAVERAAERLGSDVSVEPVEVVPGSFTVYKITFDVHGHEYTTDITIDARPTHGPQPG
jgi:hypothetical protein